MTVAIEAPSQNTRPPYPLGTAPRDDPQTALCGAAPQCEPPLRLLLPTTAVGPPPAPDEDVVRPRGVDVDPRLREFATVVLTRTLETLTGRRPPAQLAPIVSDTVLSQVGSLARRWRGGTPARLLRVHLQPSGPGSAEVCATFAHGGRVRAIAGRVAWVPGPRRPRSRKAVPPIPRLVALRTD